ncbi:MAG: hypothetical protein HW409_1243, partial [candidate division NC10 bacterium]|nr:hypothetical protein [candidate division NC10 bacterium]
PPRLGNLAPLENAKGPLSEMHSGPVACENQWLGGKDSNLDKQIQSLPSYHWTTPQENERPKGAPLDVETMKDRSTKVKVKS